MKSIDYKVKNGKLIRVDYKIKNKSIQDIKIYGDFFMYPDCGIEKIENVLKGDNENLKSKLEKVIKESGITVIGFSPSDICDLVNIILEKEST